MIIPYMISSEPQNMPVLCIDYEILHSKSLFRQEKFVFKKYLFFHILSFFTMLLSMKSPQSSSWLIIRNPGQVSKRNMKKIFIRRFPLTRFLAKTLKVNKSAKKKFLKNLQFRVVVKLQILPFTYKINIHNMSVVRSYTVILTEGL